MSYIADTFLYAIYTVILASNTMLLPLFIGGFFKNFYFKTELLTIGVGCFFSEVTGWLSTVLHFPTKPAPSPHTDQADSQPITLPQKNK